MAKLTYGSLFFSSAVETTLAASTPTKAAGTTTAGPLGDFTHSNNRLTYVGDTARDFKIAISFSASKASGGSTVGIFHIAKNGSILTNQEVDRTISNTNDVGAASVIGATSLDTNDYIELFIETANGDNITITKGSMVISVLG